MVFATGMAGTKDSGLLPFAEAFAEAGLDSLLFDYRGFGESGDEARQVAWPARHREDLQAAISFAAGLEGVDAARLGLWGWSWGASHVLSIAGADPGPAAAVIAVGPDADGLATLRHLVRQLGPAAIAKLNGPAIRDLAAKARNQPPVRIPVVGPPGSVAALSTEESEPGYTAVAGPTWRNEVAARVAVAESLNRTVSSAAQIRCPILVQAGDRDSIVPLSVPRRVAWEAKGHSEVREYPCGHWGFLLEWREQTIADQLQFLRRHLAVSDRVAAKA